MNATDAAIAHSLAQEHALALQLLEVLGQEEAALLDNDADALSQAAHGKSQLIASFVTLHQQLRRLLGQAGLPEQAAQLLVQRDEAGDQLRLAVRGLRQGVGIVVEQGGFFLAEYLEQLQRERVLLRQAVRDRGIGGVHVQAERELLRIRSLTVLSRPSATLLESTWKRPSAIASLIDCTFWASKLPPPTWRESCWSWPDMWTVAVWLRVAVLASRGLAVLAGAEPTARPGILPIDGSIFTGVS